MKRKVWKYQREVIRICKSKEDRQYNSQKKKNKRTNNDLNKIIHKTKDQVTRTPLTTRGELGCSRGFLFIVLQSLLFNFKWIVKLFRYRFFFESYIIDLIWFLVLNGTFSNISAISWWPVLLVEEAGVPGENHRPWVRNW